MFVRAKRRFKDGKEHRYFSVVENCRNRDGRVVQRQVLYLGEINDSQRAAWCRSIKVLQGDSGSVPMALFADDREAPELDCEVVRIDVSALSLHRAAAMGRVLAVADTLGSIGTGSVLGAAVAGEPAGHALAGRVEDAGVLPTDRSRQRVAAAPHWYEHSAMRDLLDSPMKVIADDTLYRSLDKLLTHKRAFFSRFSRNAGRRCSKPASTFCCMT